MADILSSGLPAFVKEDENKWFLQPMFLGGDDAQMFNVVTDAKSSYKLQKYGSLDKITTAFAEGFTGATGISSSQRTITLSRVNAEGEIGSALFFNKIDGELLNRGINRGNVEGTVLAQIILSIFVKGVHRDKNRQLWFGDTAATGTGAANYTVYDGIFKALTSLPAAQKLVFPAGALAVDAAADEFQKMKDAAPNEMLENMSDVVIFATRKVVENYMQTLKALGTERAHIQLENGVQRIMWDNIEIKPMHEWDSHLAADSAPAGSPIVATDPHRAVMTVKQNIEVATDFDQFGLETWYNLDLQKYRFRADYTMGVQYRNDELTVTSIAA